MLTLTLLTCLVMKAMAFPEWCEWVPFGSQQHAAQCTGYVHRSLNSKPSCASLCQWIPGASWGSSTDCMDCYNFYSEHYKKQSTPRTAQATHSTALQTQQQGCSPSCRWLSRPTWSRNPSCKGCGGSSSVPMIIIPMAFHQIAPTAPTTETVQKPKPDWCTWVPIGSLPDVAESCASKMDTEMGSGCKAFCTWKTAPNSECRQCSSETVSPITGCEDWCQWVSRAAWQDTSGCSKCNQEINEQDVNVTETLVP